jgi:hypothetical protein
MGSLSVNINGVSYIDHYCGISVGYGQTILNATVVVDGSDLLNHFTISCDYDWVKLKRLRNSVEIVITKNVSLKDRIGTISFTHNLDKDVYVNLNITQLACVYGISVNKSEIVFDTLLDSDDVNKEVCDVIVTTTNGIEDFNIGSIIERVDVDGDGVGDNDYIILYDGGLKLTKIGKNKLRITNYGRVFLKDDVYYTITLYHKNNPRSTAKIVIRYTDSGTNNELGFDFRDDQ